MDRILIIMKKNNGHQGIICPFTGAFFHNMQTCLLVYTYNRSQVSMYRTIGPLVCQCENKGADQLHSNCEADHAFIFALWIVQFLNFLNPEFPASSHLLFLYRPVCVGPGRKHRRPGFLALRLIRNM